MGVDWGAGGATKKKPTHISTRLKSLWMTAMERMMTSEVLMMMMMIIMGGGVLGWGAEYVIRAMTVKVEVMMMKEGRSQPVSALRRED